MTPSSPAPEPDPAAGPPPTVTGRRRWIIVGTAATGTALLGAALAAPPGSRRFHLLTAATSATWIGGGLLAGAGPPRRHAPGRRPVLGPAALGVLAFVPFYVAARVGRHLPPVRRMLAAVLGHARHQTGGPVLVTTLVAGAAEEVFFRGALYAAVTGPSPVLVSTGAYVLSTAATRNPALVAAAAVLGTLLARQRRATGGIQAPVITHVVWSALMFRFLPALLPGA